MTRRGFALLIALIGLTLVWNYHARSSIRRLKDSDITEKKVVTQSVNDARPQIVVWAKQPGAIHWTLPPLRNGDGGCDLSYDRRDIGDADAVVFFMKTCKANDLPDPETRRTNQVYVWWSHESPWTVKNYYKHKLTEFDNYFNWTMTFRTDSDVFAPMWPTPTLDFLLHRLGRDNDVVDKNSFEFPAITEKEFQKQVSYLLSLKTKLASWIVSDCSSTFHAKSRMKLAKDLENRGGVKIGKFGKCWNAAIPDKYTELFALLQHYKFYLAFENSLHCQDYLTEKTAYNGFVGETVPIIYGPSLSDTKRLLPEHSFIHVEQFKDVIGLGNYLKYLDKNDTAYKQYFEWWKYPGAQTYPRFGFNYGSEKYLSDLEKERYSVEDLQQTSTERQRFGMYHLCRKLKRRDHLKTTKIVSNLATV